MWRSLDCEKKHRSTQKASACSCCGQAAIITSPQCRHLWIPALLNLELRAQIKLPITPSDPMLFTLLSQSIIYLLIPSFHPLLNPRTHTPPLSICIPLIASRPWKAPGTFSELLSLYADTEPSLSLSTVLLAKASHQITCYVQPQQQRNAAICWGHTCWGSKWMTGILVTSQDGSGLVGWKTVLGWDVMACCSVIRLWQACCLRGRRLQNIFTS